MIIFALVKIQDSIEAFRVYISTERRLSARTTDIYFDVLSHFATYLHHLEIENAEEVTAKEVRQWQMEMMDSGLSPATVKQSLAALSSWFRYLRRQKVITTDVMAKVQAPKLPKRLPVFFRKEDVEAIYAMQPTDFIGHRDKLILRVFYETGMRRSELWGLKETSFDLQGLTVKVLGKRDKERIIPIENDLAHNINEYLSLKWQIEGCSDAFFVSEKGDAMTIAQIYQVVKKYMQGSKAEKNSPHVFRHTFATHLLNEGADLEAIKELLGHANVGVTEVYTHVTKEHLKEQYRHAHPRAQECNPTPDEENKK